MAGDIRYMDSRQDEQERNITMKSFNLLSNGILRFSFEKEIS